MCNIHNSCQQRCSGSSNENCWIDQIGSKNCKKGFAKVYFVNVYQSFHRSAMIWYCSKGIDIYIYYIINKYKTNKIDKVDGQQ